MGAVASTAPREDEGFAGGVAERADRVVGILLLLEVVVVVVRMMSIVTIFICQNKKAGIGLWGEMMFEWVLDNLVI